MDTNKLAASTLSLQILIAERVYTPEEIGGPVAVVLEGPTIRTIWRGVDAAAARRLASERLPGRQVEVVNLGAWRLAPGYVDLHIHGFHGHDMSNGPSEDVAAVAQALPRTGVTAFLPTIGTNSREGTARQVARVTAAAEHQSPANASQVVGIRLEGPFISHAKRGAQYEPGIRPPDAAELAELVSMGHGWIRVVDYAPEEDPEQRFLARALDLDLVPSIGHTAATFDQVVRAIDAGARHATHLFNANSPLDHRAPGVPGAFLTDPRTTVEVIADGIHLHPTLLKLVVAARGAHHVALITDGAAAAGLPDGVYEFVNRTVHVADGAVRLPNGTLAGSALTIDRAVRTMVTRGGVAWADALRMATLTPAGIASIAEQKGHIAAHADADLVALDEHGNVQRTWVRGQLVYDAAAGIQ